MAKPAQVARPEDRQHTLVRRIRKTRNIAVDPHVPAEPVGDQVRLLREGRHRGRERESGKQDASLHHSSSWSETPGWPRGFDGYLGRASAGLRKKPSSSFRTAPGHSRYAKCPHSFIVTNRAVGKA